MSLDEERVRNGLRLLTEPIEPDIEIESLVAGGERLRSRRRARWTASGLAAGVAIVLLAGPGLVPGPVPAVPDPATTPSPPVTSPAQPVSGEALLHFSQWDPSLPYDQVAIEVLKTGDELEVEVSAGDGGTPRVTEGYSTVAGEFWSAPVAADLVVAIIPGQVASVTSVASAWEPVDSGWLPELGLTAVAVQRGSGSNGFGGLTWQTTDGQVRSSLGEAAAATLEWPGGKVVVYRDEALGVWGYTDSANDVRQTKPLETEPVGILKGLVGTSEGGYYLDFLAVGFLPPGGTDPALVPTQDGITWTSAPLGDTGQLAILVVASKIRQGDALVESITYSDAEGKRVTYDPYASAPQVPTRPPHPATTCVPVDEDLLAAASRAGSVGGAARFVSGQMVQATEQWWFVAVKAEISDPEYARVNGIDEHGLMAFATNAPGGGNNWVPLSAEAEWDGTTPTGEVISDWRAYRMDAKGCAGPG